MNNIYVDANNRCVLLWYLVVLYNIIYILSCKYDEEQALAEAREEKSSQPSTKKPATWIWVTAIGG